jgi:MoaA/NifB/PqqE/SkfB family radical SAM enzyme
MYCAPTIRSMEPEARRSWAVARPGQHHVIDTACPAPWVSLEFDPAGWVLACCAGQMYPLGRVGDERLADLWNGPRVEVLRDALRRWDLSVSCLTCRWHLEHGRMDPDAAAYDGFPIRDAENGTPYMMVFALSNRCNLGCVMCNPELSSTLRADAGLPPLVSRYDDRFFEDLEPLVQDLRLAKFLGGEPFLIPAHRRVWELLATLSERPRLVVTTNGTVWTDTVEWLLDTFAVDVSVSIDAITPETYAGIRVGGELAQVHANLDRFDQRRRARGTGLHVSFCLMDRNWSELGAFLRWAERFESRATVNLVSDHGLALHDLPTDELERVARAWEQEDRLLRADLDRNEEVWTTQLVQLDHVLRERHAGVATPLRQPDRATASVFDGPPPPPAPGGAVASVAEHRERLERWGDGDVAIIEVGSDGRIVAVPEPMARLGIDERLLGAPLGAIVEELHRADGRPIWSLDRELGDEALVRTLGISATATRGTPGTMVRTVEPRSADGRRTVLLALDSIFERSEAAEIRPERVRVRAPVRRAAVPDTSPR